MKNDLQFLYEGMETEAAVSTGSTTGIVILIFHCKMAFKIMHFAHYLLGNCLNLLFFPSNQTSIGLF